jgi:YbgC/YbaW family acyl-CoA thioester hydrolase
MTIPTPVSSFITHRRVEFCDTDMAGIVHFANFYRYMEQAEHDFFRSLGFSIMETQPDGTVLGWPRVSAKCSFEAPAFYQDVLEIRLSIERIGVKSLSINYEFFREGQRIARGQMKTVCCLFEPGKPMRSLELPEKFSEKIAEAPKVEEP